MPAREIVATFTPERSLREKCGLVGLYFPSASRDTQINIGIQAIIANWHRGQQGVGIAINDEAGVSNHFGEGGGVEQAIPPSTINTLKEGKPFLWLAAQTRYGTNGAWNIMNLQPMTVKSTNGDSITVAHNGQFTAIEKMRSALYEPVPDGASDTYIFTRLLAQAKGSSLDERIRLTVERVNGAFSLIIGTDDSLYLARDTQGIRPLMLGKIGDGFIAVSETHALDKVGATLIRQIKRGEIVKIDKEGVKTIKDGLEGDGNFCDFEWSYFSRPDSSYPLTASDSRSPEEWKSVYQFREECGRILAQEHPIPNASFVVGVPDSGVPVSTGYANALRIPYKPLILRDHYDPNGKGRIFQTDYDKAGIQSRVHGKLSLIPDPNVWEDAIVVVGEDSYVRGDTSKVLVKSIFSLGAKEVHLIAGTSQIIDSCHLGVSMRTQKELIAWRNNGNAQKIAEEIGATSINYISHAGFIRARLKTGIDLALPKDQKDIFLANGGCGGCLTGRHPVSPEGVLYEMEKRTIPISV